MSKARFLATLFEGHKGVTAITVPFDPEAVWREKPVRLDARRDGWLVRGTVNGIRFQGYIGYRWGRYFILIDPELRSAANVAVGDTLSVAVEPTAATSALARARKQSTMTTAPRKGRADAVDPPSARGARRAGRPPARAASETIDGYLAAVTGDRRGALEKLRRTIRAIVPDAQECISYRIPAFRLGGRIVAGFCARTGGCSYFPFSGRTLRTLAREIVGYEHTKSSLHFDSRAGLPTPLVRKLLKARIAESSGTGAKKRPG